MESERREPGSGQATEAHRTHGQGEAEAGRRTRIGSDLQRFTGLALVFHGRELVRGEDVAAPTASSGSASAPARGAGSGRPDAGVGPSARRLPPRRNA